MSLRFDSAINKLYNAFHHNKLNPECCKQCAVGNILDQTDGWKHLSDNHGDLHLNYVGKVHQSLGRKFNGYSPIELLQIEHVFLEACGFKTPLHHSNQKPINTADKDILFQGLYAVVTLLCKLDHIPNVMDYTKLFENNEKTERSTSEIIA
ncbi:Na(+)-translocating NADH-quinone reductase subunit F [Tamlana haliotis]|uniref:Na(+)-translocating NADH-quinone reductase subunit F n=1 Tax=Pseudotamlana haliotis TaxID=2614804 RepID=A0A6N6MGQ6_9FLAO|nr:Na(+)-translocating NADH-quinone reductase subunit F [Tamlana haliotis]KAB1069064.1 Na(+)-translocating NADH-quinone reductase subunit F [Tamlana haliotis]